MYNTTVPEPTLKKKSNSIAYHAVREGVATIEWITEYEPTYTNVSDMLTNTVPGGNRRTRIVWGVMDYLLHFTFNTTPPPASVSSPNRAAAVAIVSSGE